jgi:hypothetical protein
VKGEKIMNAGKKRWTVLGLALLVALALGLVAWEATSVQADGSAQQLISFPQVAHGLVTGEKLRTILVNRGTRPITVRVSVIDDSGALVKQEDVPVPPGTIRTSEVDCLEALCPGPILLSAAQSAAPARLLRTEVAVRLADVPFLFMASGVVDETGSPCTKPPGSTTETVARLAANHNETLVRDVAPTD